MLVDVVVHCASGILPDLAINLINALGRRREATGGSTYFIHVSEPQLPKSERVTEEGQTRHPEGRHLPSLAAGQTAQPTIPIRYTI